MQGAKLSNWRFRPFLVYTVLLLCGCVTPRMWRWAGPEYVPKEEIPSFPEVVLYEGGRLGLAMTASSGETIVHFIRQGSGAVDVGYRPGPLQRGTARVGERGWREGVELQRVEAVDKSLVVIESDRVPVALESPVLEWLVDKRIAYGSEAPECSDYLAKPGCTVLALVPQGGYLEGSGAVPRQRGVGGKGKRLPLNAGWGVYKLQEGFGEWKRTQWIPAPGPYARHGHGGRMVVAVAATPVSVILDLLYIAGTIALVPVLLVLGGG